MKLLNALFTTGKKKVQKTHVPKNDYGLSNSPIIATKRKLRANTV